MSNPNQQIWAFRSEFKYVPLEEKQAAKNPINQFSKWMQDAFDTKSGDPNAMTLATVDPRGFPDARIVLLRNFSNKGFTFYTNYKSTKGRELQNKKACLNFFWQELSRQVRVIGTVVKLSTIESDRYFNSRPRENQISAWASNQSEVVGSREELEKKYLQMDKKFQNKKIPRPSYWGGYSVQPISIEFWQGKQNRLHDRIIYTKQKNGKWKMERLFP
jgi:pyridoxamine 5'-phosphate oxidase